MGKLILLGLPIGNIEDITKRVKSGLEMANILLCEDTRITKDLLKNLGIEYLGKKLISYHDHSSEEKLKGLLSLFEQDDVYICSDAGSPAISDPAFPLIKFAIEQEVTIETFPAVTSPMVALELSGLPAIPSHFHGFVPRDKGARIKYFEQMQQVYGTHIFFEGVSRVVESLEDLSKIFPDETIVVGRELTKKFQSIYRFKGEEIKNILKEIKLKGEFVVLVHNSSQLLISNDVKNLAKEVLDKSGKRKVLSKLLGEILGMSPKDVYQKLNSD